MVFASGTDPIEIFFSLAPATQDSTWFARLRAHLSAMRRQGLIEMWYESAVSAGSNVRQVIESYINRAHVIVLLISADFLASDQCYEFEMQRALERGRAGAARVIPVLVRPSDWSELPLAQYQVLPSDGRPISLWEDADAALVEVAKGIRRVVEELAGHLSNALKRPKDPIFPLYMIPYRPNPFFTDREDILNALHDYFTSGQITGTRIQALNGLGGIGKTQLAVAYVHHYQDAYQAIFWLRAAPRELLSIDIALLGEELGLPIRERADEQRLFSAIRGWLHRHDRWLLVLDNVEDFALISQLVPTQSEGHVLLLARAQATGPFAHAVPVAEMTIEDGAVFLLRRARIIAERAGREAASETDYLQALAIAREFDGYPLALDQAGAYIEETGRSLASYLTLYRQRRATLLAQRGTLLSDHPDPVTTTLSLAFEKIAQNDPLTLELLRFLAFLHPDAIPEELIEEGAPALDEPLRSLVIDPLAFDRAMRMLRNFSLLQRNMDTTTLRMHRIVQAVLIDELTHEQQHQWAGQAVRLVNSVFPEVRFETWAACERYLPQAQRCSSLIADFQLTLKDAAQLLQRLGAYCYRRGRYTEAETALVHALRLHEHHQDEPLEIARTLHWLALLYYRQARYQEVEALHQRALALREQTLGPDHPTTAKSLYQLAAFYGNQGQYQRAEQFYLRVLAIEERDPGPEHPATARTLNNLGLIYYKQGNYFQAETTYRRALAIYERSLSPDHPDLAYTLNGLGDLYEKQGNHGQAEQFYQRAFALRKKALGDTHPDTARSMNKLADIYEVQGNDQQAEELYQRALIITEQALGSDHPNVARTVNNLAFLANKQGRHQQAEELYQRALTIYERALGSEHAVVASVLNNLGQLYRNIDHKERAEAHLRRALAIREQALGKTHPETAQSLHNLAELLSEQGRYEEAEALFQQALAIRLQVFGPKHPDATLTREKYADLLERLNRSAEATALRQAAQT